MLPDPLHPAVVHFPIVLAILAPLFALGAFWAIRRGADTRRAWAIPTAILAALALSAFVATRTGEGEEERVEDVLASEGPIHSHEESAEVFLIATAVVLGISLVGLVRGPVGKAGRAVGALGTLALVGIGANVGHTGGELVYRYGAASAYTGGTGTPGAGDREREQGEREESSRQFLDSARAHYARILPLIRNLHNEAAAAEMLATTDKLERALWELGGVDTRVAPEAFALVRGVAVQLSRQSIGVPADTPTALELLGAQLDRATRAVNAATPRAVAQRS